MIDLKYVEAMVQHFDPRILQKPFVAIGIFQIFAREIGC